MLKKFNKLGKKAIRNIASAKFNEHTERIFKSLKLLKISDQITYDTSKNMLSLKYEYASLALINLFSIDQVNRRYEQNNLQESFFF